MSLVLALTAFAFALPTASRPAFRPGAEGLNFYPCPEVNEQILKVTGVEDSATFDCAKLEVPLDYTDPQSEPLTLSLFRVNATEEPVLGTVLMNFGGPGGTGAENIPVVAGEAHKNIGAQWNLLTWDPRGTGYTIPFNCSIGEASALFASPSQKRDLGTLASANLTEIFLSSGWQSAGDVADFCYEQAQDVGSLIGTAFTARDMFRIVDSLGEDGLLRFYGWSYGTALGSYAAAMFPKRIGRMVLDANLNPHHYQAGHYKDIATDTDQALQGFIQTCFDVGDDCALYSLLQPTTAQDILDAINEVIAPLAANATSGAEAYQAYLSVKSIFVEPLYYPTTWAQFAETLANILGGTVPETPASDTVPEVYGKAEEALVGIRASDATFIANSTEDYLPIVEFQAGVSPGFSDILSFALWPSARWRMPAKERYWGNFQAKTKNPILYVNGDHDPVTPLVNAYNGSAGFEGSVVLPHGGYGHGVFVSPSECVAKHVRAYFSDATLPVEGTHCDPDMDPVTLWRSTLEETEDS